jgi:hypothetical protein
VEEAGPRPHERRLFGHAGGMVAHYSAAPYAIFLAIHYLVAVFPSRRGRWKELASVAGVASAPLLAWFGWRLAAYGVHGALAAAAKATKAAPAESHSAGLGGRPADCGDSAGTRQRLANGTAWGGRAEPDSWAFGTFNLSPTEEVLQPVEHWPGCAATNDGSAGSGCHGPTRAGETPASAKQ